jgi:hypothetical protein
MSKEWRFKDCPVCFDSRRLLGFRPTLDPPPSCYRCDGTGRVPLSVEDERDEALKDRDEVLAALRMLLAHVDIAENWVGWPTIKAALAKAGKE